MNSMTYVDPLDSAADTNDGWPWPLCPDCCKRVSTMPRGVGSCGVTVGGIADCPRGEATDGADNAIWRAKMGANNGP